jgi:predicted DNA-binding protein
LPDACFVGKRVSGNPLLFGAPKCKSVYIIGYTSFDMARITERIRLGLKLVKRIQAEVKLQKTSVATFVRTAIERYLDELAKQKIGAMDTAREPKEVSLILETPVTLWTQAEKEFADKVIQRHFDEDR